MRLQRTSMGPEPLLPYRHALLLRREVEALIKMQKGKEILPKIETRTDFLMS